MPAPELSLEYVPSGHLIWLDAPAYTLPCYSRWYDSVQAGRRECRGKRLFKVVGLRLGSSECSDDNVWVLFDLCNGHAETRRYCWIFRTRAQAVEHRRTQHAGEGARLSNPCACHWTDHREEFPAYAYMVQCSDGSYYTGVARDPSEREKQHNGFARGGAKYTRSRRPVTLVYYEPCLDRKTALARECAIKKLSRSEKIALTKKFS